MAAHHFQYINQWFKNHGIQLSGSDSRLLMRHTELLHIPKGSIIMHQGKKVEDLYFINNGMARLYSKVGDTDTTIDFVPQHEFASTIIYILNQQLSVYALHTLTDMEALHWDRETVLFLRENTNAAQKIEATLQLRLLTWIQDRELDVLNLTPEARYDKLFLQYPEVVQQVPLKYIASYLGIHQDSLSRIRNKRTRKS